MQKNFWFGVRFLYEGHLTARSDVYSFGVVLLELLAGRRVLDKNLPNGEQNLIEWSRPYLASKRKVLRVMDARIQGQYSPSAALRAATLAVKCLALEPKYRPTMNEVVKGLEQLQETGSLKIEDQKHHCGISAENSSRKAASYPRPRPSPSPVNVGWNKMGNYLFYFVTVSVSKTVQWFFGFLATPVVAACS